MKIYRTNMDGRVYWIVEDQYYQKARFINKASALEYLANVEDQEFWESE